MANTQVHGCCCGIPFSCGTLALGGLIAALFVAFL